MFIAPLFLATERINAFIKILNSGRFINEPRNRQTSAKIFDQDIATERSAAFWRENELFDGKLRALKKSAGELDWGFGLRR
jgi:hypothetical protein